MYDSLYDTSNFLPTVPLSGETLGAAFRRAADIDKADVSTYNMLCVFTTSDSIFLVGISEERANKFVMIDYTVLVKNSFIWSQENLCENLEKYLPKSWLVALTFQPTRYEIFLGSIL